MRVRDHGVGKEMQEHIAQETASGKGEQDVQEPVKGRAQGTCWCTCMLLVKKPPKARERQLAFVPAFREYFGSILCSSWAPVFILTSRLSVILKSPNPNRRAETE